MRWPSTVLTFIALAAALATSLHSQDLAWKVLVVPPNIPVKQEVTAVQSGWEVFPHTAPHHLTYVEIYDGHPKNQGAWQFDKESKNSKMHMLTWVWNIQPTTKEGAWIQCHYAETDQTLCTRLPDSIKELRISYNTNIHVQGCPQITKIEYR